MRRRGFTIVEMLMVIGVLGILITLVTMASSTVIRKSRIRRTDAMKYVLQAGFATYYTQKGEWPGKIQDLCDDGPSCSFAKIRGYQYLDDGDADAAIYQLVKEAKNGNPLLDVSGLFVASVKGKLSATINRLNVAGRDFREAVLPSGKRKKIPIEQMAFGYPESEKGRFRRFVVKYNFKTDSVEVLTQSTYSSDEGITWQGTAPTAVE